MKHWLQHHTFQVHTIAFALMAVAAVPLYMAAQSNAIPWIWILMGVFIVGNLLVLAVK